MQKSLYFLVLKCQLTWVKTGEKIYTARLLENKMLFAARCVCEESVWVRAKARPYAAVGRSQDDAG